MKHRDEDAVPDGPANGNSDMHRYKSALNRLPDTRPERVDDLRDAVESGDYYVESKLLAERVVNEALHDAVRRSRVARG
jgi:hypothetical protein